MNEQMRCTTPGLFASLGNLQPPRDFRHGLLSAIYTRILKNHDKSVTIVIFSNPQINKFGAFVRTHYGSRFQISCRSVSFPTCNMFYPLIYILWFSYKISIPIPKTFVKLLMSKGLH